MFNRRPDAPKLLALGLAVLMATPACSLLFVQPLTPAGSNEPSSTCTTSAVAPVLDTLFVGTNLASVLYVAGQDNATNKGQAIGLGLSVASLWLASAVYGYTKTSECAAWVGENRYVPPPPRRRMAPPRPYAPPFAPAPAPPPSDWNPPPSAAAQAPATAPTAPAQGVPGAGRPAVQPVPPAPPAPPAAPPARQQEDTDTPT